MIGSGSGDEHEGRRFGGKSRRAAKKSRRKWTPEPGGNGPERSAAPPRRDLPPTRHDLPAVAADDHIGGRPVPDQPPYDERTYRTGPPAGPPRDSRPPDQPRHDTPRRHDQPPYDERTYRTGPPAGPPRDSRPPQPPPRPWHDDVDRRQPPPGPPPERRPPGPTADQAYTVELRRDPPPAAPPPPAPAGQGEPGARGFDRYATDGFARRSADVARPPDRSQPAGTPQRGGPVPAGPGQQDDAPAPGERTAGTYGPKKLTVTRVAGMRSRELSGKAVDLFQRAHKADGADKSGLTSLSWALMLNYASDAALAVALANTLFFSAATAESQGKVALYLLITIAPFSVLAPLIGPALDRVQRGRRLAMSIASVGQALMCLIIAMYFDSWLLYPAALGKMVLSRSFMVLKSAVTPRVVPPDITLSKTNARLTIFGLAAGGVGGGLATLLSWLADSPGALVLSAAICVVGAVQAMRIPSWVESTEGEVPATLNTQALRKPKAKQSITEAVVVALWGTGTIRVLTGFLTLFAAFAVKDSVDGAFTQLLLLGVVGGAAGAGGFLGNAIGSRLQLGKPDQVIIAGGAATLAATLVATILPGIATAAIVGLIGSTSSSLAKISVDAIIQRDLPEQSRASAFGRSETVLQLAWCFGGAVGLLLPPTYWIGFLVVSLLLAFGLGQTVLLRSGRSLLPRRGTRTSQPQSPPPPQSQPPQHDRRGSGWSR